MKMKHEFVEFIPETIEANTLYVSMKYGTAVHKCCCGCGSEVVTPLTPTDWSLTYDGDSISLSPSIGNWEFECKSHYWIRRSRIEWAGQWSQEEITEGREQDQRMKNQYYQQKELVANIDLPGQKEHRVKRKWWIARVLFGEYKDYDG